MRQAYEPYKNLEQEDVQVVEESLESIAQSQSDLKKAKKRRLAALIFGVCGVVTALAGIVFFSHQSTKRGSNTNKKSQAQALLQNAVDEMEGEPSKSEGKLSDGLPCVGNQLYNEVPLTKGQYICSGNGNYAVGFDDAGDFVWLDLASKIEAPYFDHDNALKAESPTSFMLEEDGTIVLYKGNSQIVWKLAPKQEMGVQFQDKCLYELFSCPLLQLHNDGVLVLRWRDENDEWIEHNLYKVYGTGSTNGAEHPSFPKEDEDDNGDKNVTPVIEDITDVRSSEASSCVGDRLSNGAHLKMGDFICSKNNSYVIGLSKSGDLVWMDNSSGEVKKYYDHAASGNTEMPSYFVVGKKGSFIVSDSSHKQIWKKEALAEMKEEITFSEKCLQDEYDCPYLHLHNDGVLVLNWVDGAGWINDHDVRMVFGFFKDDSRIQE